MMFTDGIAESDMPFLTVVIIGGFAALTACHLQATFGKLLTYGVLRSPQPPTLCGMGTSYGVKA